MLIKSIELNDFRQFIGRQVIEFSTDPQKNVTVLIGVNTSGKTTLIKAFEWILYEQHGFEDPILLNKNVVDNMKIGEIHDVMGILTLNHNGKEYEIKRTYTYTCIDNQKVRLSIKSEDICYLQADGQTKTKIESEFRTNIERILPETLSSYFFFGGERVGAISNRKDIEASVKGLMGLDVLDNAMGHLRSVISKLKKGMDFSGDQTAQRAQQNLDGKIIQLQTLTQELQNTVEQIEYYQDEKIKYAALLKGNEQTAELQKRREQLDSVILGLKNRIIKEKDELVQLFSNNAFSYFGIPLLKRAIQVLNTTEDDTESVPEMTATTIEYILNRGTCICGTSITEGSAAEKHLLAEKAKQPPESIGAVVRRYREQGMEYLSSSENYYNAITIKYADIRSSQRDLGFRIDELKTLVESLNGQKDVSQLEEKYRAAEKQLSSLEKERNRILQNQGACQKDADNFQKTLDIYAKANEKNSKISLSIDYANAVFEWIRDAYQAKEGTVRSKLEQKVNNNFGQMYHGSRNIIIDEKYRVSYYDVTTDESDGLKAVKSFAFISGLVDLAKEALASEEDAANIGPQYYPLVMDAPFSNVDEIHIRNISKILPISAEQVIIAVMQKDWEPAEPIMAGVIGKSYRIVKDQDIDGCFIDTQTHIMEVE
ncbi:MAG: AAA family ATPase [Christensenellaceae bacterium]